MTQGKQDDEKQMVITALGMLTFSTQFPDYMYPGKKQMTAQVLRSLPFTRMTCIELLARRFNLAQPWLLQAVRGGDS